MTDYWDGYPTHQKVLVAPAVYALIERAYGEEFAAERCEKYVYVEPGKSEHQLAERCHAAYKNSHRPTYVMTGR